ncbi:MAG: RNA polymerase sigma factor [Rhodobacteraceae bacterium]|nr:RNA polymerase sigma factor [Paracoccaceae bacterium]
MESSDESLARAAAGGDRAAFAALAGRHYDRVFRLAFRLTGGRAEAEDLTQDVCLALPARLAGWRGEARFTTWLYRVVVNAAHDRRRRNAARARAADGWGAWEEDRRAAAAEARAAGDWLARAMGALAPELRDTVALVVGEGLTQAEAASVLGLAEGTVAWRMAEVRRRLKALAGEEEG